ncbi:bifunctional 4-hydroxy-2-oxoglutarate aldolase/2-dehydro-3-deoxy-phosphogluconate aldolase [Actinoplanes sp. N902-109]|uniref:bifunctional 4-hydroxy-2-oxoglutarate aldolase/2-dehydro-3-deoxy-phosphogluconate aldolase n=1 Tax=Actinoplanes sp. (strain N902-109) TaxID=649831 RepID=UPI000329575A|nr:bifunctional 4-hydroxy-2-oxoglutarate aldolase/2-dehydro-3-deoxy-phosphogluconate aldolase [Actinoplanes sp. N902-109]AGL19191.1 2-keto-3-deoxy-6-phosphogluconate aldolase [Actinoplanes sp. N902-109]
MTEAELARIRVLPVVVIDDPGHAEPLAHALTEGGVPCAEITLRTPEALAALAAVAGRDGFVVGAGTVRSRDQAARAADAGARFLVSPGFDRRISEYAAQRGAPLIPGVATASELMAAAAAGHATVKFFPAALLGGPAAVSALSGPFPDIRFVPSGGIALANAAEYDLGPVLTVSTSWIAPRDVIAAGRFDEIADRARRFRAVLSR